MGRWLWIGSLAAVLFLSSSRAQAAVSCGVTFLPDPSNGNSISELQKAQFCQTLSVFPPDFLKNLKTVQVTPPLSQSGLSFQGSPALNAAGDGILLPLLTPPKPISFFNTLPKIVGRLAYRRLVVTSPDLLKDVLKTMIAPSGTLSAEDIFSSDFESWSLPGAVGLLDFAVNAAKQGDTSHLALTLSMASLFAEPDGKEIRFFSVERNSPILYQGISLDPQYLIFQDQGYQFTASRLQIGTLRFNLLRGQITGLIDTDGTQVTFTKPIAVPLAIYDNLKFTFLRLPRPLPGHPVPRSLTGASPQTYRPVSTHSRPPAPGTSETTDHPVFER